VSDGAHGDFLHLSLTFEGAALVLDTVVGLAARHGLVCFDPQQEQLMTGVVPGPSKRRPGRPSSATLRRLLTITLEPAGFVLAGGGVQLELDDDLRLTVTPATVSAQGQRVTDVSIAVYRAADWQRWLQEGAMSVGAPYDPDRPFSGTGDVLDFGLLFSPGELLDRPHHHGWLVPDQAAARRAARHIGELVVERVVPFLPTLAALLPNDRVGLRHRPVLGIDPERWLDEDEACPWAPCGERGRTTATGGLWPG
jgi:hypothetical protein